MKNWIWLHCFGLYTTVMSRDESILEVMHDYRDWCFATLYMLDQACSLCIKMQQSNKVFTFVHVFINGINFVHCGEFVCVWHCLYLSCHKLVCIVMIYLDPPKSQPPVHFFLKYLDPSEMFYPPTQFMYWHHLHAFKGVQNISSEKIDPLPWPKPHVAFS